MIHSDSMTHAEGSMVSNGFVPVSSLPDPIMLCLRHEASPEVVQPVVSYLVLVQMMEVGLSE